MVVSQQTLIIEAFPKSSCFEFSYIVECKYTCYYFCIIIQCQNKPMVRLAVLQTCGYKFLQDPSFRMKEEIGAQLRVQGQKVRI